MVVCRWQATWQREVHLHCDQQNENPGDGHGSSAYDAYHISFKTAEHVFNSFDSPDCLVKKENSPSFFF